MHVRDVTAARTSDRMQSCCVEKEDFFWIKLLDKQKACVTGKCNVHMSIYVLCVYMYA